MLVVLVISACRLPTPSATHSPSPTTHVELAWTDCTGGFQCATLHVPLDYSRPEGRQISLALIRKPVTDPSRRIGSLLMNPGGPGGSGVRFLRGFISYLKNLNARFDVVSWDPRGVGASTAVTCLDGPQLGGFEKNIEAYLADCKTRITCTLARAGDPREKLVAMMDSLDKAPLPVGNRQLTRSLAMLAVLATMYNQLRWKGLDDALTTLV